MLDNEIVHVLCRCRTALSRINSWDLQQRPFIVNTLITIIQLLGLLRILS